MAGKICIAVCLVVCVACVTAQNYPSAHASCPAVPKAKCFRRGDVMCNVDDDCAKSEHCCPTMCNGRACKNTTPAPQPEVECPMVTQVQCFVRGRVDCESDEACGAGRRCCTTQCNGAACYSDWRSKSSAKPPSSICVHCLQPSLVLKINQ